MLTAERLAQLREYGRLDDCSDFEIEGMAAAAKYYLKNAGVAEPVDDPEREEAYYAVLNYIVADLYDNRGSQTAGYELKPNPTFRQVLNQLKLTEPVSVSDTGSQ